MNKLNSIVIGVDFSECSGVALWQAARIAKWNRSNLTAVHVVDTIVAREIADVMPQLAGGPVGAGTPGFDVASIEKTLREDAKKDWEKFMKAMNLPHDVKVDFKVEVNNRTLGILSVCTQAKADLLVLGATGSGRAEVGIGTVTTGCVRKAPCDVLVLRENKDNLPFRSIVACVDFSPTSLRALEQAALLATEDGASLYVLHVFNAPWHSSHYRSPTPENDPAFREQYRMVLERRLENFGEPIKDVLSYVKPIYALLDAQSHRNAVGEFASGVQADLIVLGTRGRTNLRDIVLGSTAEKILRDLRCSVLAVRHQAE